MDIWDFSKFPIDSQTGVWSWPQNFKDNGKFRMKFGVFFFSKVSLAENLIIEAKNIILDKNKELTVFEKEVKIKKMDCCGFQKLQMNCFMKNILHWPI